MQDVRPSGEGAISMAVSRLVSLACEMDKEKVDNFLKRAHGVLAEEERKKARQGNSSIFVGKPIPLRSYIGRSSQAECIFRRSGGAIKVSARGATYPKPEG